MWIYSVSYFSVSVTGRWFVMLHKGDAEKCISKDQVTGVFHQISIP